MAEENANPGAQGNESPKGTPEGVRPEDLNSGEIKTGDGIPKAPEISNKAPELTDEEKAKIAEAEAAEAAKKAEADGKKPKEGEEEAPKEEESNKDGADQEGEVEVLDEYIDYGDETANSVVATLKEAGIDPAEAHGWFADAVASGDMSKIPLDKLQEKLGKEKANLVMLGVKDYYTRTEGAAKESAKAVHDVCGSEENWVKVRDWAKARAANDPDFAAQVEAYNKMFELSKVAAQAAARELVAAYEGDSNNSSLNKKLVHGDSPASVGIGDATLTRSDYLKQIKVAEENRDYKEANRLRAVRLASKKAGY